MRKSAPDGIVGIRGTANTPQVPPKTRVYAIGDVHGRADLLGSLLATIAADAADAPPETLVLVFLGDYVDRGPDSRAVVERISSGPPAAGPLSSARWVALRGNHEDCLFNFLKDASSGSGWFRNGGAETLRSYLGTAPEEVMSNPAEARRLLAEAMPPSHVRFLSRLPLSHVEGDYVFVHAGMRPGIPPDRQNPQDLMWVRDEFLHSREWFGRVVVHGHSPVPVPEMRPNRIGVDTGAWLSGRLTALVLEGTERRLLMTGSVGG